jgi:outer membrane receptor for ferrienterochelin and colicin
MLIFMRKITLILCLIVAFFAAINVTFAQGVTTASIGGTVKDTKGEGLPGATVVAIHTPSGSKYATATQPDGRFVIQGMRVGGPYTVTTTFIGFKDQINENVYLSLGTTTNLNVKLSEGDQTLEEVTVVSSKGAVISGDRTGAATNIAREQIERMPTISRSFADVTRLTPQASASGGFGGRNGGFNNVTIDGAIFNNSFGLSPTIGGQAAAQPISLDAIEQVQVSIAPFDVRQGSFTGAGVNAVTRSGTNTFSGSIFSFRRTDDLQGFKVGDAEIPKQDLSNWQYGFRLGGPIIKNKLFFFVNGEIEDRITPSTSFQANKPGLPVPGGTSNTSAASAAELNDLRNFVIQNLKLDPGGFESFGLRTYSQKATAKIDWNISDKHKFSIKYNYLLSYADIAPSNSGAITSRSPGQFGMPFQSSYYTINNNLNSVIAELNSRFSNEVSNTFQIGFTSMRDFRESFTSTAFPMVDIANGSGQQLTAFGYEPFTYNNKLDTDVFQFSNNLTIYKGKHTLTFGTYNEFYRFSNGFAPTYYGAYQFPSIDAFKASVRAGQAGANATAEDLTLGAPSRYQLRYSALPDGSFPLQNMTAFQIGLYGQDEWAIRNNVNLTLGLRVDMPVITADLVANPVANNMTFRDGLRTDVTRTPGLTPLWSPRIGFNWDVFNNKKTQVRGGTGIFTGRVPYVWISNQVGGTGSLFGAIDNIGGNARNNIFNPNVNAYVPSSRVLSPSSSFNLAFTDPNFKFPQVWRTNLAIDQELPWGIIGTLEGIYTADLNAVYLENVNLTARGVLNSESDRRPVYFGNPNTFDPNGLPYTTTTATVTGTATSTVNGRIYANVTDAIQLRNTTQGYSLNLTAQLQKNFGKSLFTSIAYNYMDARSVNDGGSVAQSMWRDRPISGDPNAVALSYSNFMVRHRFIASVSYRKEYAKYFATSISVFFEAAPNGRVSYVYQGDANGDNAGGNNDLLFVPRTRTDINLVDINNFSNGVPFTYSAAQQWSDLDKYIGQDPYLSGMRGQYVERNGMELPVFAKADLSIRQDFILNPKSATKKQTLQLSFDVFNFTNMLNSAWGVEQLINRNNLLTFVGREAVPAGSPVGTQGRSQYSFPYLDVSTQTPLTTSFRNNTGLGSRWVAQIGIRYIFN